MTSEWQDSRSRLDLETKQPETFGLVSVSFDNLTPVSSRSCLALIFRSSFVSNYSKSLTLTSISKSFYILGTKSSPRSLTNLVLPTIMILTTQKKFHFWMKGSRRRNSLTTLNTRGYLRSSGPSSRRQEKKKKHLLPNESQIFLIS